jgi:predicted flavoprotein YhiN
MPASENQDLPAAAVIGGGPAGLMAAEVLAQGGIPVDLYDAMPSVGRKFLIAGRGGLNLTHSEPLEQFLDRYGARRRQIEPLLAGFGPDELRSWVHELGFETFVGTSGRVFPVGMKTSPLLRAWLGRLRLAGVVFHPSAPSLAGLG